MKEEVKRSEVSGVRMVSMNENDQMFDQNYCEDADVRTFWCTVYSVAPSYSFKTYDTLGLTLKYKIETDAPHKIVIVDLQS